VDPDPKLEVIGPDLDLDLDPKQEMHLIKNI
jgi:hypothetical protein